MLEPENNTGPLSIDDAVGLLGAAETSAEPLQDQTNSPGDNSTPADATGADQPTGSETEAEAGSNELPPIEAPRSWNAEGRAKFASLPRDVQEVIATREGEREGALTKAQQEAAETRKKAEAEYSTLNNFKTALDRLLPQAEEMFQHRWGKVDWVKLTEQIGAEETTKLKFQYDHEMAELQRVRSAQQAASEVSFRKFVDAEATKLQTLAPELADPKEGPSRRQAVGQFLIDSGIPPESLRGISAAALAIAYDAMRYRQAQKSLAKQPAATARPAVKPAAARPVAVPQKQKVAALKEQAFRSGRIDDMVALLNAESGA